MKSSTMKRKLLTMLLVFAVVASYIPFDRAFAAGGNAENSRRQEETAKAAESSAQAGGNTSMLKSGKPVAKVKSTRGFPADGSYDIVALQHEAPPLEKTIINDAGKINTGDKNVWPTLYKYKIPVGTTELNIKSKISYYATDPKGKMEPKSVWYGVSFYSSDLGAGEDPGDKWLSFGSLTNMTLGGFDDNDKIENKAFDRIVRVPENAKYVMVCSNSTVPEVTYRKAKAGRLFLSEIPVAEALQAGKSLGNSKIHLGKVTYNGDEVKGTFSWKNGSLTPQVSDGDTTEYEAKFTPTDKIKYGNGFEFKLKLKVYRSDGGGRFSSFVWHSGGDDLVPEEYMKNRKNIDTVYSIGNIFNSYSSLTNVTAKSAAKIIARNLLTRPEGRRAISIEGYLGYLLGGATLAGDNLVEPKDSKARAVKDAYYKSTGDGTDGYMFFDAPMRDNSLKDKLGIPAGKSGCEVFRDKMDAIFEELNDMGVKPDYVYSDIEHVDNSLNVIRNRHRLELDATTLPTGQSVTAHWNVVWNNARFQREIKPELMKRRFIIKNSNDPLASLRSVSPNPELKGFSYGINPSEEAITSRHNVNAWNVVMKNYTQSLFKRYLINPVKEHFPEAKCSCWDNGNTDSWMNGSYIYESYLGGSTDGGGDSYSCPPIYGQTSDEGILKYNVDNWRNDTVRTAFTSMQHSLRQYRVAVAANGGKVHPFVPNRYFFTETYKYSSFEYFKEFILHVFLQNPDKMISYVNYNDVFAIKNKESLPEGAWPGRHTFANIVLEDLEKISGELDEVAGNGQEVEPLSAHMPQGSDPFVITGLRVGNKNFWRITPDLYKKGVLNSNPAKFMKDFHKGEKTGNDGKKWQEFEIDGKTVKFPEGKIIKPAILASSSAVQYGYWVETKAGVEPKVSVTKKTDGTYENYFRDRTLWEEDFEKFNSGDYLDSHGKKIDKPERFRVEAQSGNKFATEISSTNRNLGPTDIPQYSNVIGEWARNQVWEDRVKFSKVPSTIGKGVEVLNMGKTPVEGFGKVLTFRGDGLFYFKDTGKNAKPTMSEKVNGFPAIKANTWYVVRRTIGVDASGRMSTKITAFEEGNESGAKTVSEVATGVFNPDDYVASPIGGPIFFYNFDKDTNLRVSVDDCKVYATDFNVKLEVFRKNDGLNLTKIKETVGHDDDELVLKTTWLNADKKDVGYSVKVEEKGTGVDRTYVLTNGVVPYGENSYSAIKMKKLLPGTKSIRVTASTSDGVVRRIANVAIAPSGEKISKLSSPSSAVPAGYHKVVFNPTSDGKIGTNAQGASVAYKVRNDVSWGEVKGILPATATYKDATKKFKRWSPYIPSDIQLVYDAQYTAEFKNVKAQPELPKVKPLADVGENPGNGYVKAVFDPTVDGKLAGSKVGSVSMGEKLAYALRDDLTWSEVKSELPVAATYKDATKKFAGWQPALQPDSEKVKAATYVAQYTSEPDIIDVTDPSTPTPSGYAKVTFDKGEHGESLEGTSAFFVKKNTSVNLSEKAPTVKAKAGYKFKAWDRNLVNFNADANNAITITATYDAMAKVQKLANASTSAPQGYVKAVFDPTTNGKLAGSKVGSVSIGEKLAYALRKDLTWGEVKSELPTGATYKDATKKFTGWSPALQSDSEVVKAATYVAQYAAEPDIIDVTDPSTPTPSGYAKVTFEKGEHGESLEGTSAFFVKKNTEVNLTSRAPKAKAKAGWKFKAWNRSLTVNASSDIAITATYDAMDKVQKLANANMSAPEGYVKVVFDPTSNGKLAGSKVGSVSIGEKLAYALRKDLTWGEVKSELPTGATYKDATKKFTGWNPALQSDGDIVKAATYVAQYASESEIVDVTDPSTPTPSGYAKVTFDKGEHGESLEGTSTFFVKKNTSVNLNEKAPVVKAKAGYKFKAWDKALTNFNAGSNEAITITAIYEAMVKVQKLDNANTNAPEGYVKAVFDPTSNGKLAGSKVGSVSIGEKLAYALRKDLTWGEVKSELPTGATYKDATKKFTGWNPALQSDGDIVKAATYVAQYASESEIVDVTDPSTPTPSGYAKVTFEKGEHGESLEGTSTFFVKKNTSVNLNEKAPVVKAKAGYKFKAWDKALTNFNAGSNEAITITATYEVMVKVIDVTDPSTPTPSGYVKVTFDKGEHGESLEGTSTFFVLKNVQVDLTAKAPKAKAKKGYKFKTWDKGLIITAKTDENITITATYNEMPAIRKLPNAIAGAPEGYEKVVFDPTLDGKLAGAKVGSVSIGEKLAYALRKDLTWGEVKSELPVAATYKDTTKKFTGWSPALQSDSEKVKEATYVAQYAAEPDIIDVTDPSMPTPSGYAKVTFDKGEHGESLEGTSAFFVKKNTEVNLSSRAPKAKAKAGWKFKAWDRSLIVNASSDITITATYEVMVKVQKLDNASTSAPEGYVKAVFDPTSNGKLAGSKVGSVSIGEKLAYALRKDLTWSEVKSELPMAATYKDATKKFTGWSPALQSDSEVVKAATYVAQYAAEPDIIDVTDPSTPTPVGYAKVTFDKGEHGESLKGTSTFFVKKNTEVNLTSRAPKAKAKAGWKFKDWNRSLTVNASSDITITATYEVMVKVIDVTDPTMPTPSGYVKVTFDKGEHGESLEGTSAFFVLKNVQVDLTAKAPKAKAKKGYKFKTWDKGLIITAKTDENITITATYNEMPAIRKLPNAIAGAPEGYEKVVFDPTLDGKLAGAKVGSVSIGEKLAYALRKDLTWGEVKSELPVAATYKDTTKKFTGWSPALQPDSEKVKAATYVAQYAVEPDIIDVTDPSTPTPVGYAKATFDKGEHGDSLEGTSTFFVKKNTEVNLSSRAPKAKAKTGWKFKSWDRSLIVNASSDITITAIYEAMVKVQKLDNANTNAPEGYVKAVFDPTSDGKLTGNKVGVVSMGEKLAYALRDDLTWGEVKDELPSSATYKDATKKFTGWQPALQSGSEVVKAATYVAQYATEPDIIYVTDPSTPTPSGYAKVTFDKGEHGESLTGTSAFFVKKNMSVNLSEKAPTVKAKAGYKFKSWDRNLANFNAGSSISITITATYEVQENIIDVTDPSMPIPEGYVKVTFDKGEHGESLEGTSAFFVLKNVKINLTGRAPKVKAEKGYRFKTWSKGLIFTASSDDEIVITATYNEMPAIRKLPNEIALAPEGYVKAVFDPTSDGKLTGSKVGAVSTGEKLAYALRDDLTWGEVKSELPTGATYKDATKKFTGWSPALQPDSEKVKVATYVAQYAVEPDIIDVTDPSTPTPVGYAKATFDKGEHGDSLEGTSTFFVKKNTEVNLSSRAPKAKAKTGWKFKSWDRSLIVNASSDITITATYEAMVKVQKLADASTSAPEGYVKAVFDPTSDGKLTGSKVGAVSIGEKLAYALRNDLTWSEVKDELPSSAIYKDATKKFTGWNPNLPSDGDIVGATTYVAQYESETDVIDVTNPSTPTPAGYAKVTFDKGEHGAAMIGTEAFFVKKNTQVNLSVKAPTVKAKAGYKFKSWDRNLANFNAGSSISITITATYDAMDKVQKLANASTSAPQGYVKAVFDPTSNGKLAGSKVGSVSMGEKLAYALRDDLTWSEVKDELPTGATYKDATKKFTGWSPALQPDSEKVKAATYVAQYAVEPDIIDVTDPSTPTPVGYAKATFDKGEHGDSLEGTSTFFVKKNTEVNLTSRAPKAKAKAGWKFKAWDRNLANFNTGSNEAITITATYDAMDKVQKLANASTSAPEGYVKAVFDPTSNGKLAGSKVGSVSMGEKLAYALRDDLTWSEVKDELPTGATYKDATKKFTGWSPALQNDSEKVKAATYVAQYATEPDIIDVTGPSTPTPSGYAKVTFEKGEHGESLEGTSAFFVKKNTEVNLTSRAPKAKAKAGWKFKDWNRSLTVNASSDITITATYDAMVKVQKLADASTSAPEGYVKAVFDPTSNGKLAASKVGSVSMGEKLAYALRKDLTWGEVKNELPTGATYKDATKKFTGWAPTLQSDGEAVKTATYVAQYAAEPDIIDVTDPSTPTPAGYAKVTFDKGEHGAALIGTETFFVKKNTEIDFEGLAPKVRAKAGYKFKAWNKELKLNVNADVTITAQYTVIQQDEGIADPVAPSIIEDPGTEKPAEGYVRIVFDPTVDGRLDLEKKVSEGKEDNKKIKTTPYALGVKKVYDIKNQILWKHVKNIIAPAVYHKDDSKIFAGWDELFPEDKEKVRSTTYKAQFKKNPGMKIEPGDEPPEKGYSRIVLEPTAEGRFNNRERQQKLTFDVKEDLRWKDVKEQIKCNIANYTVNNPVADKVFDGWDGFDAPNLDNVMIKRILKITEPHEAKYVEKGKEKVEYKVDKNVVNVEYVSIFRKPENVPKDPAIFGKKFVGWQIEGEGRAYTKEEVERIEIIESITFVAKLEDEEHAPQNPTPQPPEKSVLPAPTQPRMQQPLAPAPESRKPLIIRKSGIIRLTPKQQQDIVEGKYSYVELITKKVSLLIMPEQFSKLYKKGNVKTFLKVMTKSKKKVAGKTLMRRIAGEKIFGIRFMVSGKLAKKYSVKPIKIGLPLKGKKLKNRAKVYIMRLSQPRKGAKAAEKFTGQGKLIKGIYDRKSGRVFFKTKQNVTKKYFAVLKKR